MRGRVRKSIRKRSWGTLIWWRDEQGSWWKWGGVMLRSPALVRRDWGHARLGGASRVHSHWGGTYLTTKHILCWRTARNTRRRFWNRDTMPVEGAGRDSTDYDPWQSEKVNNYWEQYTIPESVGEVGSSRETPSCKKE